MERLLCLVIGYFLGTINTAYLLGKAKHIDIRNYGSGNAGMTNASRVLGVRAGYLVLLVDGVKCWVAVMLCAALFGGAHPELRYLYKVWALAGVILGHDYPFYMQFKGGKGVAVMAGFGYSFHWSYIIIENVAFFIPYLATHYVSLGSLCLYASAFVAMIIEGQRGVFAPATQGALIEMYVIQGILTFMAFYRHRSNIGRLVHGNERKTYLFHKKKDPETKS